MRSFAHSLAFGLISFLLLRGTQSLPAQDPVWAAPELTDSLVVLASDSDKRVAFDELIEKLAAADAVFLGEQHTDETTHRFQLAVYERLLAAKDGKVVLALEMFDRDVQGELDRYLAGEIDEAAFLEVARPWSNYREAYRPLIEKAKEAGAPVVAANFPAPLRTQIAMGGADAVAALDDEQKAQTPREYLPNSPEYWKRVDNAIRSHAGMMGTQSDDERLYSVQSLWDNAMGEACADALDSHAGHLVLHINGGFHSAYGDGAVAQLRKRKPEAKVQTVAIIPATNPDTYRRTRKPEADYEAIVERQATNIDQGKRTVAVGGELSYKLHLPESATAEQPAPLLIWLGDEGLTAEESMQLCREIYGASAAIIVVEPPYKELGFDLVVGGRWFWPETFAEDTGALVAGVEEIWAYAMRHFPIVRDRVCVAGEGAGATMAAAIAVHTERLPVQAIALRPSKFTKLKDSPLPLPEYRDERFNPLRSLLVFGPKELRTWWKDELAAYDGIGIYTQFEPEDGEPLIVTWQQMHSVSGMLQTPPPPLPNLADRKYLIVENASPRARHWGRLQSMWLSKETGAAVAVVAADDEPTTSTTISTDVSANAASQPGVLPKCPGPFGGTTVIVLPDDAPQEVVDQWLALETDDPLSRESRFHRTRIAVGDGDRSLVAVLEKLHSENRNNVLIVPAEFYARHARLHALRASVAALENEMTIQWLPGLGGREGALQVSE
jgi:uncharacterized iron-regulated protein